MTIAVVAFRQTLLTAFPQFATFHAGFVFIVDGIVAFLLFGQFAYRRLLSYAVLGRAYLFSALVVIPFLFTFPGALKLEGTIVGGSQSAIWIWHAWHIMFPLIVTLSLLVHKYAAVPISMRRVVPTVCWMVSIAVVMALLVGITVTAFHDHLPVLITATRAPLTSTFYVAGAIAVGAIALSLGRHASPPPRSGARVHALVQHLLLDEVSRLNLSQLLLPSLRRSRSDNAPQRLRVHRPR